MAEYIEKLTIGGKTIVFRRPTPPVQVDVVAPEGLALTKLDITDPALKPSNYERADGSPMPIFEADDGSVRVDLSKRTKQPMSFWHRNADCDELIFCYQGSIIWETELGRIELQPGEMLLIPRGIAHRSLPGTEGENIVIELKTRGVLRSTVDGEPERQGGRG